MGNGQCSDTTASGNQCKRKATHGDLCKQHHDLRQDKGDDEDLCARPPELEGVPDDIEAHHMSCIEAAKLAAAGAGAVTFTDLADVCLLAAANPLCKESVRIQWMREARENIRLHVEDLRRSEGQHVVYHIVHEDPLQPEEDLPPLPELPPPPGGEG